MPWLRKETGGCVVLGYHWSHDGAIVEVSDADAATLLSIFGGGYTEVEPPRTFSEVVIEQPQVSKSTARGRKPPIRPIITE